MFEIQHELEIWSGQALFECERCEQNPLIHSSPECELLNIEFARFPSDVSAAILAPFATGASQGQCLRAFPL